MKSTLRVINLGAGVQSSTMLLMALKGELGDAPDYAIFADTGWEPKAVYQHLAYLESIAARHSFPIHKVSAGNIRDAFMKGRALDENGGRFASLPMHVMGLNGKPALMRRQCTREFKVAPLEMEQRRLLGVGKGEHVPKDRKCEVWIGISTDEAGRMRDPSHKWQTYRYPLIDKGMSRADCLAWLEANGYRLPSKSACIGCPYHDDAYWSNLRDNSPAEFADAVEFDHAARTQYKLDGEAFLHRSLIPLDKVEFGRWRQQQKEASGQINMFINECEGMCGV